MSEGNLRSLLRVWVIATLAADAGLTAAMGSDAGQIYYRQAPEKTTGKYVIFSFPYGVLDHSNPRNNQRKDLLVRCFADQQDHADDMDDAVSKALNGADITLNDGQYKSYDCTRRFDAPDVDYPGKVVGKTIYSSGGFYQILLSKEA